MKFTDRSIESLKSKDSRYLVWKDSGEGLGLRVSPKGRRSFIYMYRYGGRARMMTLGDYPQVSLADANLKHREAIKLLKKGIDPGAKVVAERKAEREAETIQELVDEYMERWAKPRKRTWKKDDLILKKDVLPEWRRYKAKDVTRRDVVALLDKILKREAPIQANRTLAVIRKMFNFALGRDIVQFNPCIGVRSPSPENQRDRVLTEAEIKTFWEKLDQTDMHKNTRNAYRLMLLTAQRIGEVVSSRWQDMDLKSGWWIIPAERSKNKLQHRVPLSPEALAIIEDIKQYSVKDDPKKKPAKKAQENKAIKNDYLFPSPREGQHIDVTAMAHALKRNMEKVGVKEKFTPHDLRRTAASHMTGAGISRLVVSKILNHVESHITAVYDRHSYDAEKRHALDIWAKRLAEILAGTEPQENSNVVPIKQAK